jgi:hypothetical protein
MFNINFGTHLSACSEGWFASVIDRQNFIELDDRVSDGDCSRSPLLDDGEAVLGKMWHRERCFGGAFM